MARKKLTPAQCVHEAFGGVRAAARALHMDPSSVCRWARPKDKGGTDGLIPSAHHERIMQLARRDKLDLSLRDIVHGR